MHLPPGVKCLGTRVGLELGVWHFALAVQAVYRNLHWIWPHWYCGLARDLLSRVYLFVCSWGSAQAKVLRGVGFVFGFAALLASG